MTWTLLTFTKIHCEPVFRQGPKWIPMKFESKIKADRLKGQLKIQFLQIFRENRCEGRTPVNEKPTG